MIADVVLAFGAIVSLGRGAWRGSLSRSERHGRGELVRVVDRSVLALALADYGAPRVGCARHVDVPFESVGNHAGLAILDSIFVLTGGGESGMRSEEKDIFEA
jgi:hypothetical protein